MKDLQYKPPEDIPSKTTSTSTSSSSSNKQYSHRHAPPSTSNNTRSSTSTSASTSNMNGERHQHHQRHNSKKYNSATTASSSTSTSTSTSALFAAPPTSEAYTPWSSSSSSSSTTPASSSTTTTSTSISKARRPSNQRTISSSSTTSVATSSSSTRSSRSGSTVNNKMQYQPQHAASASTSSSSFHAASPAPSTTSSSVRTVHEDEIESSLRQWRNHVFPSLKAGNYISPGQETPDKDPIHPLIEPILPSIFASPSASASASACTSSHTTLASSSSSLSSSSNNAAGGGKSKFKTATNSKAIPIVYDNGRQFLDAIIGNNGDGSNPSSSSPLSKDKGKESSHDDKKASEQLPHSDNKEEQEGESELEEDGDGDYREDYESNWRLEMVLGQTRDLINTTTANASANAEKIEGIWIALWSGEERTKSTLLEFCLMKLPSRPLVISSPIPIALLPTALLQDRMQILLNAYLSIPSVKSNPSPFSLIMGPSRVVEAFLLHYDSHQYLNTGLTPSGASAGAGAGGAAGAGAAAGRIAVAEKANAIEQNVLPLDQSPYPLKLSNPKYTAAATKAANAAAATKAAADSSSGTTDATGAAAPTDTTSDPADTDNSKAKSESTSVPPPVAGSTSTTSESALSIPPPTALAKPTSTQRDFHHRYFNHSAAPGRTVKPLLHTRAKDVPPAVSLSEGFAVRLAEEKDDLRTLVSLFQAYSHTLDHTLEENAARRAVQKAMSNQSIWIYHIYSQSLPGLSLIAGFLTTERKRPYTGSNPRSKKEGGKGKGAVAITAVFTDEAYRSRGVAESLVRTATRYYLVDLEYDYVSVYVDPRNESTCRVFSRVGYGIMDREVKEEIPVKLIRDALHVQWEEEKVKLQAMLDAQDAEEQAAVQNKADDRQESLVNPEEDVDGTILSPGVENEAINQSLGADVLSTSPTTPTLANSLQSAQDALKLLSDALLSRAKQLNVDTSNTNTSIAGAGGAGNSSSTAESGNFIPTAEENEAALQAENGKPLCTSAEEWQVVSLKSREVALIESRSRTRGQPRREDWKRMSSEGPWH